MGACDLPEVPRKKADAQMTNLEKFLEKSNRARVAASETPYKREWLYEVYPGASSKKEQNRNAEFILEACNTSEIKDEMIRIMAEALYEIVLPPYKDSDLKSLLFTLNVRAAAAIVKVEELAKNSLK